MGCSVKTLRFPFALAWLATLVLLTGCPKPHGTTSNGTNAGTNGGEGASGGTSGTKETKTPPVEAVSEDEKKAIDELLALGCEIEADPAGHAKKVDLLGKVTEDHFKLLARLPELQILEAKGPEVKDAYLAHVKGLKKLRTIDFNQADVGDEGLKHLVDLPLQDINLMLTNVRDEGVKTLAAIKTIRNMRLIKTKVTDQGVAHLKDHPAIEFLDLQDVNTCGNASLETAATLPKLKKLRVYGPQFTDAGMEHVAKIKSLVELSMEQSGVGDAGFEKIAGLSELKKISMYGTQISDASLDKLTGLAKLQELELRGTATGATLNWLKNFPALKALSLEETYFTDDGIPALLEAKTVEDLNLRMATLNKDSLLKLAAMKNLTKLNLDQLKACDDDVAAAMSTLENLTFIHVGSTSVTDKGVNALVDSLKKLDKIEATRLPEVTQANVERIRAAKKEQNKKFEIVF